MITLADFSDHEDEILAEYERKDENRDEEKNDELLSNVDEDEDEKNVVSRRIDPSKSQRAISRNPIPKLNTERLKGPKGIHTIEKHFEGFKFYGKGREKMDLDRIMKRLEHWAHRLFPKLDFDDFLEKTEKLGSKKDLSVFVTKYRHDMISLDDPEIIQNNLSDDEPMDSEPSAIDAFDLLIAEQIEKQKEVLVQHNLDKNDTSVNDHSNDIFFENTSTQCSTQTDKIVETSGSQINTPELSYEIKERIERNRLQALERRRLAKLKAMEETKKKNEIRENAEI
ncbi:PREDICTED: protein TIPIN homolog [Polistes dominula]|uniref:TIMELESS-interacting protein n=1 Tax=Polistes dominula TaxID=743375 RepID=A0ABM1J2A1_POLDO|nr:PREDICTED: protein TIPIN homolog [Polistes dominula]